MRERRLAQRGNPLVARRQPPEHSLQRPGAGEIEPIEMGELSIASIGDKSRLQPGSDGELSQTLTFVKNGAIISLSVTFISMVLSSLAGYGFSRFDFPGKKPVVIGRLSTQMFPYVAIMLPIYLVYRSLNLLNTLTGIIIGITGLVLPLGIWMLKTYIDTIDKELEEAALIEGANRTI